MKGFNHTPALAVGAFFLLFLVIPSRASAYLDPGTGSYLMQIGLAIVLGALFAVKLLWKKIKGFINDLIAGEGRHAGSKRW